MEILRESGTPSTLDNRFKLGFPRFLSAFPVFIRRIIRISGFYTSHYPHFTFRKPLLPDWGIFDN
jgi:hypothetical protein